MSGIALSIDDGEMFIPECGYKKKDGSILICDDCRVKIQERITKIETLKDVLKLIDEYKKEKVGKTDMKCWDELDELKVRIEGE